MGASDFQWSRSACKRLVYFVCMLATQVPDLGVTEGRYRNLTALIWAAALLSLVGWALFLLGFYQTHQVTTRGMFPAGVTFSDLTVYVTRYEVFRTPDFFLPSPPGKPRSLFAYPPGAALCYRLLYRWGHRELLYSAIFFTWWSTLLLLTLRTLKGLESRIASLRVSMVLLVALSYPAWFLLQRANIEIFLWILLFLSAVLYARDYLYLASFGIGLAASIKLYPILLLGLFFKDRKQWGALFLGLVTAISATAVEIWRCAPGFFWFGARGFFGGVAQFQAKYAGSTEAGNGEYDHSLFSWVKGIAMRLHLDPSSFTRPYYLVCGSLTLLVFMVFVRKMPFANRVTFLLVLMVLLPPVSFTYTLVHLYLPVLLLLPVLVESSRCGHKVKAAQWIALCCLLLLLLPIDLLGPLVRSAGKLQALPLLALLGAAAWQPWTVPDDASGHSATLALS